MPATWSVCSNRLQKKLTPKDKQCPVSFGISNFKDPTINLKYATKDATDFKNFLVSSEHFKTDHVKLLTNEKADRENIIGMLGDKWLGAHVKRDDLVVVLCLEPRQSGPGRRGRGKLSRGP